MASSLYEQTMQNQGMNAQFNNFMMNPIGFLMQKGANIPMQYIYMNNPEALAQYLLNTGQMTQEQLNVIRQKAAMMGVNV